MFMWFGTSPKPHAGLTVNAHLVRLTTDAGLHIDPALSSDGSLVAYASDRQGTTGLDIWVQPVAGGTARRLTADEGDETEPDFSPDGASIVYAAREKGGIFVVGTLGGKPRLVAAAARARTPRFSPDGKWIAYWTGIPVWDQVGGAVGASGALAIVPPTGGSPRVVAGEMASARYGVWSPDSKRLLFVGERYEARIALPWGQSILVYLPPSGEWRENEAVSLLLPEDQVRVWPTQDQGE